MRQSQASITANLPLVLRRRLLPPRLLGKNAQALRWQVYISNMLCRRAAYWSGGIQALSYLLKIFYQLPVLWRFGNACQRIPI